MYSESKLGILMSWLHDDIRARLSLKKRKAFLAVFCIRFLEPILKRGLFQTMRPQAKCNMAS